MILIDKIVAEVAPYGTFYIKKSPLHRSEWGGVRNRSRQQWSTATAVAAAFVVAGPGPGLDPDLGPGLDPDPDPAHCCCRCCYPLLHWSWNHRSLHQSLSGYLQH